MFIHSYLFLHRSGKEGGITEDVEDILGCGYEKCLSLFDADSVDVCLAPEANNNDEGVGMKIDFCGYLYDDAIDGEVRAVDEFGIGFGRVVGSTVFRPNLIVDGFLGLLDMQFTGFTLGIHATEVIDAICDIGRLLDLDKKITGSDSMESSCRQEIEVSLVCLVGRDNILHGRMPVDSRSGCELFVFLGRDGAVKTGVYLGAHIGFEHIPHLGFSHTAMPFLRQFVIGMHLDGEVLARVNELNEQREFVAELLIDTVADEESFIFVNELGEVETEIDVPNDTALHSYGLMTGYGTDLPGLTDIGLSREDTFERGYLVTSPDHGAEIGLELVRFHRN